MPYGAGKIASGTFGTMAFQDADAVDITGGTIVGLSQLQVGIPGSLTAGIELANDQNANIVTIQAGQSADSRVYVWPEDFGAAGSQLTDAAGDGTLSWGVGSGITIDATLISGGNAGRLLFQNSDGTVGQSANVTFDGTDIFSVATLFANEADIGGDTICDSIFASVIIAPEVDDGAPLGDATHQFSDLFLAEGGVINWDGGDATLTQAGNVVTLAGADLTVPTLNASAAVSVADGNGRFIQTPGMAVANLPGSPVRGMRAYVTDSNATSYTLGIGAVVAAGGSTIVPVFYDGTNWRIG